MSVLLAMRKNPNTRIELLASKFFFTKFVPFTDLYCRDQLLMSISEDVGLYNSMNSSPESWPDTCNWEITTEANDGMTYVNNDADKNSVVKMSFLEGFMEKVALVNI